MTRSSALHVAVWAVLASMLPACSPRGEILEDGAARGVGVKRAGNPALRRLIEEATGKVLASVAASDTGTGKLAVGFLGLDNQSGEPLGDFRNQAETWIDGVINTSGRFKTISREYLEAGLREAGVRRDQLYLPRYQRQVAEVLEKDDIALDLFLKAVLTSGTTDTGSDTKEVDYTLTLELVDVKTGENKIEQANVPKRYTE